MKILFVEDNPQVSQFITKGLTEEGHSVDHTDTGRDGLFLAMNGRYDAIILDRMLPDGIDGLAIIAALRTSGVSTPIMILSAITDVDERIRGLRAGGDDYLTKPFSFGELLARLEVLVRRTTAEPASPVLVVGNLRMDPVSRKVQRGGQTIHLQPREFKLLEFLMRHAGQVVTRTMLLEGVWDYNFDPQTNVIDVHISNLRQKIDAGHTPTLIRTVRGAGYMLSAD